MEHSGRSIGTMDGRETSNAAILDSEWMKRNAQYSKNLVIRSLSAAAVDAKGDISSPNRLVSMSSNSSVAKELIHDTMNTASMLDINNMIGESARFDHKRSPRPPIQVKNEIGCTKDIPVAAIKQVLLSHDDVTVETKTDKTHINSNLAQQLSKIGDTFSNNHLSKANTVTLNAAATTARASNLLISRDLPPTANVKVVDRSKIIRRGYSDDISNMMRKSGNRLIKSHSNNSARRTASVAEYGHVYLNVYDLEAVNKVVNVVAGTLGAGAYHAGVEIYGHEYNFGYTPQGGSGIVHSYPRYHASHKYRKSIDLGGTKYSPREVIEIVERLRPLWLGASYDILRKNCLNFADTFCKELGVGSIPSWVMGLQNKINWTRDSLQSGAAKLKQLDEAVGITRAFGSLSRRFTSECSKGKN